MHSFIPCSKAQCLFVCTYKLRCGTLIGTAWPVLSVWFFLESHKYATVAAVKSFTVLLLLGIVKFCLVVLLRLSETEIRVERVLQLEIQISSAMCYDINIS